MLRSVLALAVTLVLVGGAYPADDPPGPKIDFPDVKGLTRGKIETDRTEPALGYWVSYTKPGFTATVYVFNRGLKKIPDGTASDEVKGEMKRVVEEIDTVTQRGLYKSFKEVGKEETVSLGKQKGAPSALRRQFEIERKNGPVRSEAYVTGYKNHFVKIRITHDPDDKAAAEKTAALLEALGAAIK